MLVLKNLFQFWAYRVKKRVRVANKRKRPGVATFDDVNYCLAHTRWYELTALVIDLKTFQFATLDVPKTSGSFFPRCLYVINGASSALLFISVLLVWNHILIIHSSYFYYEWLLQVWTRSPFIYCFTFSFKKPRDFHKWRVLKLKQRISSLSCDWPRNIT